MGQPSYEHAEERRKALGAQKNEVDFHGCDVRISGETNIYHKTRTGNSVMPTVRSHREGIKVGCTFVTNEALERIYRLHKSFTDQMDSKTHQ